MPSSGLPRVRRQVVVACALLAGALALVLGFEPTSAAFPYRTGSDPALTLPTDVTFVRGQPGESYLIEADGDPVPAIGVDQLPEGLHLVVHGDGSATLSGTPTGPAGLSTVEVRAQSTAGATVAPLEVTIQQAPKFRDRGPVLLGSGEFGQVLVRTVGYPAPSIGLEGDLPDGLTFVDNGDGTATISGTPADDRASVPVTLTAVNVVADVSLTTSVRIVPPDQVPAAQPAATPALALRPAAPQREP